MTIHSLLTYLRPHATLNNVVLLIAVFIGLGWLWGSVTALGRNYEYRGQVAQAQAQNESLSFSIEQLRSDVAYHSTEEYEELAARKYSGLARAGESLVLLPQEPIVAVTESEPVVQSNLSQWWEFLLGSG